MRLASGPPAHGEIVEIDPAYRLLADPADLRATIDAAVAADPTPWMSRVSGALRGREEIARLTT